MGSIKLVLNIDRVDLIIAACVVVIALIAVVGLIAWFIKTGRQNKTLKQIDDKLTPKEPQIVIREVVKEKHSSSKAKEDEKKDIEQETEIIDDDVIKESEDETDVLEEIRKMMVSQKQPTIATLEKENYNVGKSGKAYTREEIEKLIND